MLKTISLFRYMSMVACISLTLIVSSCGTTKEAGKSKDGKKPTTFKMDKKSQLYQIQGRWACTEMLKEGRSIDFKKVSGEVIMKFQNDQFTMSMGGTERTFSFVIEDGLIRFTDVKNYPNIKIVQLERGKTFIGEQYYPDAQYSITWKMVPMTEN